MPVACGPAGRSDSASTLTPCSELIPGCTSRRLPDIVLTRDETHGGLRSTDGVDTTGILTSDEALVQVDKFQRQPEAKTVRVILGSEDPTEVGGGSGLYYVIEWTGVPEDPSVSAGGTPHPCIGTEEAILDASSGDWLGGG